MKGKQIFKRRLGFLFPPTIIREKQFSKKDVKRIKDNISNSFAMVRLIIATVFYFIAMYLMISMNINTGGQQIQVYGLGSTISQIVSMFGSLITIGVLIPTFFVKNKKAAIILDRIAAISLFVGLALQMLIGLYADAEMGFTTVSETMSASIVFLSILIIIQPAYWTEAFILDLGLALSLIGLSSYCTYTFGMKCLHYYVLVGAIFPICCYFVVTLFFYAEAQHYTEVMENERLTDKAYYDNLTKCKNRHALKEFIKDSAEEWKNKDNVNLLIILFDIDNFKLYNDQFSHLGGDYCLKSIADAVRGEFTSPSLDFFRYGGEEFLLFFELNDKSEAPIVMEKVRKAISGLNIEAPVGAPKDFVTVSLGGLFIEKIDAFHFEETLAVVDKYLYMAKANGKDVSCFNGQFL